MNGNEDGADEATRIKRLDPATVDRIAAGEVVERPASAVKELLENAIDADASRVTVAVEAGGKEGIRVSDDGIGMAEADVRAAVEKHTTSKIAGIEDLEAGLSTLGFRGEALAAIGAVSRLSVRSKPRGGARGTELTMAGGEIESVEPVGCPEGTTVEVSELFYNVPARRKYLKRDATEFAHVSRIVTGYALANPDVGVTLEHGSREVFSTAGRGDLRETVLSVYGRDVATAMIRIDAGEQGEGGGGTDTAGGDGEDGANGGNDAFPDGPLEAIDGLVSHPETTRANASYLTTIVNGRYVTSGQIRDAVLDAYGKQLAPDRYPFAVVALELPPEAIDVNVHPRKLEVRFSDEERLKDQVRAAVERTLLNEGLVRSGAPRGRSAPTQTRIEPESVAETPNGSDDERSNANGTDTTAGTTTEAGPKTGSDDQHRTADESDERDTATGASTKRQPGSDNEPDPSTIRSGTAGSGAEPDAERTSSGSVGDDTAGSGSTGVETDRTDASTDAASTDAGTSPQDADVDPTAAVGPQDGENPEFATEQPPESEPPVRVDTVGAPDPHAHRREATSDRSRGQDRNPEAGTQTALTGSAPTSETHEFDRLPPLRVLGQFEDTYVVCESPDGLVLVDQHAADERITYEELQERLPRGDAQVLADPVELELTADEAALFDACADALAGLGFYASRVDGDWTDRDANEDSRTVRVTTVPAAVAGADPTLLRDVLSGFVSADHPQRTIDAAANALLADLACYPAITGNTSLSAGSIADLLSRLDECENPYACPHGRPVVIEFDSEEIAARFERDYPGHGGRRSGRE